MATFNIQNDSTDYKKYLLDLEEYLIPLEFRKFSQKIKGEDFTYWKIYNGYQIGILVYDWTKFDIPKSDKKISIMYVCMLLDTDGRYELIVNDEIDLNCFESVAKDFYNAMEKYTNTTNDGITLLKTDMIDEIIKLEKFIFEQFKDYEVHTDADPVRFTEGIMLEIASTMIDECLKHFVPDGNPEIWKDKLLDMKKEMLSHYA